MNNCTSWYLFRFSQISIKQVKEVLDASGVEYFLPSYVALQNNVKGKKVRVEKSLMFSMMFVHAELDVAVRLMLSDPHIHFVLRASADHPLVSLNMPSKDPESGRMSYSTFRYDDATFRNAITIPDRQMELFMKAVKASKTEVIPFVKPSEEELERGDKVRIIGGDYDGLEGILESQQGKDGGTVLVNIENFIAVRTTEIRPEFIQILEFARTGKHMYKKFDSFMTRGERCMEACLHGEELSARDVGYLLNFVRRFSELNAPTANMRVKHAMYMMIAFYCLGDKENTAVYEEQTVQALRSVNSELMTCKALIYLYVCTRKEEYRTRFNSIAKSWGRISADDKKRHETKRLFMEMTWMVENETSGGTQPR